LKIEGWENLDHLSSFLLSVFSFGSIFLPIRGCVVKTHQRFFRLNVLHIYIFGRNIKWLSRKQLFLFAKINLLCAFFRVTSDKNSACVPVHPEGKGSARKKRGK
jgi:hypothetical protein